MTDNETTETSQTERTSAGAKPRYALYGRNERTGRWALLLETPSLKKAESWAGAFAVAKRVTWIVYREA